MTPSVEFDVVTGPRIGGGVPGSQDRLQAPRQGGVVRPQRGRRAEQAPQARTPDEIRANIRANEATRGRIRRGDATGAEAAAYNRRDRSGETTGRGPSVRNLQRFDTPRATYRRDGDLTRDTFDDRRMYRVPRAAGNRVRAGNDNTRRQGQRTRQAQREFDRRAAGAQPAIARAQSNIAGRNRVAGGGTQVRADNFRRRNPTAGQQQLAAVTARRGTTNPRTGEVTTGRIQESRSNAIARYNRAGDDVGFRNQGLIRQNPNALDENPTIRAPRGDAPRLDGRRVQRAQTAGAKREVARQQQERAAQQRAKAIQRQKTAVKGAAARQGTKTKQQVTQATGLTKRGPEGERLFTPENRAKALQRAGRKVKQGGTDSMIGSRLERSDNYISAGGKVTVAADEGGGTDMSFKSINRRKGYASDDEMKRDGFKVRTKSGVDKKLNMANVSNQQATVMDGVKIKDKVTAQPIDIRRAKLYKRATNGALDFVDYGNGSYFVEAERLGPTTWKNIKGEIVEFDPKTLGKKIDQLADKETNRRLLGRRVKDKTTGRGAGNTKAQLKVKNKRR